MTKNKKGVIVWLIPIVIIVVIIIGFGILGGSYKQLFKNISGQASRENNNYITSGASSVPYEEGGVSAKSLCISDFNKRNIPSTAICSPNPICKPYLLSPDKSGRTNAQGLAVASFGASYCCGKIFLPERCIEQDIGKSYLIG